MPSRNRRHDVPLLFKYTTAATARTILSTIQLRWSSPLLFNDPFDIRRDFELPFGNAEFLDAIIDRFASYLRGEGEPGTPYSRVLLEGLKLASRKTTVSALLADLKNTLVMTIAPMELARGQFRDNWSERVPGMRILCFSANATSPAMWAHYARDLSGAVLSFESSDERDSPWLLAQPVIYRPERPSLPPAREWARATLGETEIDWESYLSEYYFVKSADWSYEEEYRVASDNRQGEQGLHSDYYFFPEDLRQVILGPRIDAADANEIRELVSRNFPNALVDQASLDYATRRVVVAGVEPPAD
jgi:hypothetical protein